MPGPALRNAPMELLETRCLLASVWDGGGATDDWNDPTNWDDDQLPDAADDVTIGAGFAGITITSTNDVTINSLTTEAALAISGGTFTIDQNTATNSTINNAVTVSATGVLTLDGLSLGGTGTLTNSATVNLLGSTISTALSNQGLLLIKADGGASTISGALTTNENSIIRVQADGSVGAASLTVANSFTNNGAIELTAINGSGNTATLNVTSGTLTNAATRTISSLAGTGGARNLNAQINNQGLITVDQGLTINQASAGHSNSGTINVNGGDLLVTQSGTTPKFTNTSTGNFTIASGRTLNLSGGSFTNFSGGTLTDGIYNVAGTLKFDGAAVTTNAATIVLDGASSAIVNQSNSNALSGFNTNAAAGNFTIKNGRNFTIAAAFSNVGDFTIGSGSLLTVSANVTGTGLMETVGTGEIDVISGGITGGTLSNAATGILRWSSGALGGAITNNGAISITGNAFLTLSGTLNNAGTITQFAPSSYSEILFNSAVLNNSGLYDIQENGIPMTSNTGVNAFNNLNGGILRKSGPATVGSADLGTLPFNNAAGGSVDVRSGTLVLSGGGTFGGGNFTFQNNGVLNLTGGSNLNLTGTYTGSGAGTVVLTGGTLNIGAAGATFNFPSGMFQWSGGTINASAGPLTNQASSFICIFGIAFLNLSGTLNNAGTITQFAPSSYNEILFNSAVLNNSGLYDIQENGIPMTSHSGVNAFNNLSGGILRKSGPETIGSASLGTLPFNNAAGGIIDVRSGTLILSGGGTHEGGSFTFQNNGVLDLTGGSSPTLTGTYNGSGAGTVILTGGTLNTGVAGATFNFPSGMFQWTGGAINAAAGPLTNQASSFISIVGTPELFLSGTLNNAGTITQFAPSSYSRINFTSAVLNNSGLYDIQENGIPMTSNSGVNAFNNLNGGILRKSGPETIGSANLGTLPFNNAAGGIVDVRSGTLNLSGGGTHEGGTITFQNNGVLDLTSSPSPTLTGTYNGSGAGTVILTGGTLNIGAAGATFNFPMFRWSGGTINASAGPLTNQASSFISIVGTPELFLSGTLNNAGTITQFAPSSYSRINFTSAVLNNSGLYDIQENGIPMTSHSGVNAFNNLNGGILRKSGPETIGSADLGTLPFSNAGTVEAKSGTLSLNQVAEVSGNTLTGGTWNVFANSTLTLNNNVSLNTNNANITLNGGGSNFTNIPDLASNNGNFTIQNGRDFTTAAGITEFSNAGSMNVAAGTTFTVSNGKKYSQTAGTTTLNGVLVTTNSTGVDIQGGVLQGNGDITGNLRNAGQVNAGTSPGSLDVSGNYTQTAAGVLNIEIGGTTAITQFDQINITGSATLDGTLNVSLVNSFVPNVADSFQIMTFASHTGDFSSKNGLTISSTLNFDPQFNPSGYLLDVNGSPVVTSNASQSVAENTTAVTTVTTTDPDVPEQTVTFSIVGGADAAKFQIVEATGVLSFVTAPDFEVPTDAGTNNVYNVTVQANDGHGGLTTQEIAVSVTPVNDNSPVFTSSETANVAENTTAVLTVAATDSDMPAQSVTFSITGGADQSKFSITSGGVLTFQTAPDFENPTDNGTNNIYNVQVTANDNNGSTTVQNIAVTVTAVNDNNPVFTSAAAVDVAENETAVLTVTATDADLPAQSITFSLVGGADQSKFSITSTGVLTFQAAPDFENPTDDGTNNIYNVTVQASDGNGGTTTQDIVVTITPVAENAPVFTSASAVDVAENMTAVLTVTATDADLPAQTITFSIVGGADAAKFSITSAGVLTFQAAPDFETPTDAGTNNIYNVIVRADDGNNSVTDQSIAVTVMPVNDNSPVFTSAATADVSTGVTAVRTVTATDADQPAQTVTFSITGGADAAKFSITSGGVLTFQTAPDFANPTDVGADNVYNVQVTADDSNGLTTVQNIAVTVTDVPINPPVFTSSAAINVAENSTAVVTVTATDPDAGQTPTFSIVGGADAAKFSITDAGVLTFQTAPDFETPTDVGTNNVYNVTVQADDGNGGLATQDIAVTVTPVNDNSPVFTSSVTFDAAENTTAIGTVVATDADSPSQTVTYSLSGGADQSKFSITTGGVLSFQAGHDFENPNDAGTNNVYNVQVTASDGNGLTTTQDIAVTVTPVNDNNPVFTSGTTVNVAENSMAVLTVTATDADQPSQSITFSLVGGADQAKFSITSGGVLTFQSAPDFENPTDDGTNNVYNVTVQADDGNGGTTTQNIAVTVTAVNDNNPVFTSATTFNVAENSTSVGTVSAADADSPAQSVTFSLSGGADQSKFSISSGGVLSFNAVHDFENPNDVGTNNVYNVQVTASDGNGRTTTQDIAVTVTNLAPSTPTDGDPAGSTIIVNSANGTTVGITAFSTDPAGGNVTFSLTDDADGRFTIHPTTGVVTVANGTLIDSATTHTITVQASDGVLTSTADFEITVTNVSADFGDAPTAAQTGFASSYPTGFSNNGAFHLPTGPTLGATRDVEFDGQPNLAASGDDTTGGTDDEDGITFLSNFETGRATAIRVNVQNAAVTGNFLDAWIDWNRDGDWNDAGEQISAGQALVSGDNVLTITVPTAASIGDTYARFRLSTTGELAPTGEATDGEVEDHRVSVAVASAIQIANRGAQPTILQNVGGFLDVISSAGTANRGVSDDGRYVVFVSDSNNLVPEDTNNADDVFRFDRVTGEIRLVSINRTGTASTTGGGSGFGRNTNPVISADGQIVAFASQATDLVTNDSNGRTDVFVRNFNTNTTTLVSVNSANTASGNGDSAAPMLSADGTVVGFLSTSSNLAAGDTNGVQDVFVRNLTTNTTSIVSRNSAGNASGNGLSDRFTLSADGRSVAFQSFATNLTAISDTNGFSDVFVRNLTTNTTTMVSVNSAGNNSANNTSFSPSISADGRVVSFLSLASNLVTNDTNGAITDVFVRNLTTNTTRLVSVNSANNGSGDNHSGGNVTSADGSTVAFQSTASNLVAGDANGVLDVFVRNFAANVTTLVSVSSAGAASGNGLSFGPALSANGQTVAFISLASNLTVNDSNGVVRDVFVRDLSANTTTLASATASGSGSGASGLNSITISANGRTVAFESDATNLVAGDNNSAKDVFTFAIPGGNAIPTAPLDVNVTANTVIENAAAGTLVGITAFSTDPEAATVTYSLTNNAGGRFAINSSTGVVTVANGGLLDFETATIHTITVQASDGANVSTAQFTINVANNPSIPAELVVNLANTANTITVSRIGTNLIAVRSGATDLIAPTQANDFTSLRIVGGTGNDSVTLDASLVGFLGAFAMEGNAGNDTLIATAITGVGSFNTQFFGGDGADLARGGAGVDFFDGGAGNDSLFGNAGNDFLSGGADNDSLDGGDGNDQISGGQGNDSLLGGGQLATGDGDSLAEVVDGTLTLTATGMTGLGTDTVSGFERATLTGGNGNDTINANTFAGVVILIGGAGNDMLFGGLGADTIRGGEGNDTLVGNAGNDSLEGQAGNDSLTGSAGNDALLGGADDDVYSFATAGTPAEADTVVELANEGNDLLDFSGVTVAVTVNLTSDGITAPNSLASHANRTVRTGAAGQAANFEGARGGSGADSITGNGADNFLDGGAGNDTLVGNAGNDSLSGGLGIDSLLGGAGNDQLNGGDGNDALLGGTNDDVYFFQAATASETDTLTELANEGVDRLDFSSLPSSIAVVVNLGLDALLATHTNRVVKTAAANQFLNFENARGGAGNDQLLGNANANQFEGGAGNDLLSGVAGSDFLAGETGDDVYLFGAAASPETDTVHELENEGIDRIDFNSVNAALSVTINLASDVALATLGNLTVATANAGEANHFENAIGGFGSDSITGNNANNSLSGGAGNDTLTGGNGNDTLNGGGGNDSLIGQLGDDTYVFVATGQTETDRVSEEADAGNDSLDFSSLSATVSVTVNLTSDTALAIYANRTVRTATAGQATNFENAIGGAGNDFFTGNNANNLLRGGAGNDTMEGGAGNDTMEGAPGVDELRQTFDGNQTLTNNSLSGQGNDTISGFARVILTGGNGANVIDASTFTTGSVTLSGLAGNDTLFGGAMNDSILGGDGTDVLNGGAGNDIVDGGVGDGDSVTGGLGDDTLLGGAGTGDVLVKSVNGTATLTNTGVTNPGLTGSGTDTFSGIELVSITGGSGSDIITATAYTGALVINGGDGADQLQAGTGNNTLNGGAGADLLTGGSGNDQLAGGADNDTLVGNAGNDTLAGGLGDDLYRFLAGLANSWVHEEFVGMGGTTLTIGRGVKISVARDSHVLSDGQDVPPNFTN